MCVRFYLILGNAAGPLEGLIFWRKVGRCLFRNVTRIANRIGPNFPVLIFKDLILQMIRNAYPAAAGRDGQVIDLHVAIACSRIDGNLRRPIRSKNTTVPRTDYITCNDNLTGICSNAVYNQLLCRRIVVNPGRIDILIGIFIVMRPGIHYRKLRIRQDRCVSKNRCGICIVKSFYLIQRVRIQCRCIRRIAALYQSVQVHVMARDIDRTAGNNTMALIRICCTRLGFRQRNSAIIKYILSVLCIIFKRFIDRRFFRQLFLYLFGSFVIEYPLADRIRTNGNRPLRLVLHDASVFSLYRNIPAGYAAFPGYINAVIFVSNADIAGMVDHLAVNADIAGKQFVSLTRRIANGNKRRSAVRFFRMDIRGACKAAVFFRLAVNPAVVQINIAAFFHNNGVIHHKVQLAAAGNADFRIAFCRQRPGNGKFRRIDPDIASGYLHIRQVDTRYIPLLINDVMGFSVLISLYTGKTGSNHFLHQTVHIRRIVVVILGSQGILHILL